MPVTLCTIYMSSLFTVNSESHRKPVATISLQTFNKDDMYYYA